MELMPAAFGRQIHLLEQECHVRLFVRSTRRVSLTHAGRLLLPRARQLVSDAEELLRFMHSRTAETASTLRVGTIDSAAAGLMPRLLRDLGQAHEHIGIELIEDKTVRLIPKLINGSIDIAFVRPPQRFDKRLACRHILLETPVLALPDGHELASFESVSVEMLDGLPMILPSRRSRPHSHDVVVEMFNRHGVTLHVAQEAQEKHTILSLVAANLGAAIVPRWTGLTGMNGVIIREIRQTVDPTSLPVAAMWVADWRNTEREQLLCVLEQNLESYKKTG